MKPVVYCYNRCTTCKKALKFLDENGVDYELIPIYDNPPSKEDYLKYFKESGLPIKRFFNTSGVLYREQKLKDKVPNLTEDEAAEMLSSDGRLDKRPLLVYGDKVYPGFREAEWKDILNLE